LLTVSFKPFPIITTDRLVLRQVEKSDVKEIFFLRSDSKVMEFLDRPPAKSKEEALLFIDQINELEKNNNGITWGITLKPSNTLIGTICYWNMKKEHYRAEIGYALYPDFHGRGIMHEAMNEVIRFGFARIKLHSIEANVNPHNTPSIKLLERNNFIREGYFKEDFFYNGKFLDSAIYSLLISNYKDC
jgi:[ribosomal protein S5]-alanine N-acetyltransferase